MASPFTQTAVANYNANPPSDDGAQNTSNQVKWSTIKAKLPDPIKAAFDTSESGTSAAFGKIPGGAGITSTAVDYGAGASDQGKLIKVTVAGKIVTTPDATVVGAPFLFRVLNASSGDITIDGNGTQTVDGDLTFTLPAGCGVVMDTDGTNWFTNGRNFNSTLANPQGYLTLISGSPVNTGDVSAATTVYYTPFKGDRLPISTDGLTFKMRQFSELPLTLVSNHLASTLYDVFLFDNSGVLTIGTGPAWNNSAAGSGARGAGAGTTELQRLHGVWTNKNAITARNGSTTYSVAANQGTLVGSIFIDAVAGQVSFLQSYGQSRKCGVSNAYNRQTVTLQAGDPTASWGYQTSAWRAANNTATNFIDVFSCLPEEIATIEYLNNTSNLVGPNQISFPSIGIGLNVSNSPTGFTGKSFTQTDPGNSINCQAGSTLPSKIITLPFIGINRYTAIENGGGSSSIPTFLGGVNNMLLTARWMV